MSLIEETDFGTPRSKSETMVTLTIDGNSITVPEGTSIMRAAMEAGTQIPKLCATDMVDAFASRHGGPLRLLPALPDRDRGPRRHAGLLHHARHAGPRGAHAERKAE